MSRFLGHYKKVKRDGSLKVTSTRSSVMSYNREMGFAPIDRITNDIPLCFGGAYFVVSHIFGKIEYHYILPSFASASASNTYVYFIYFSTTELCRYGTDAVD